MLVLNLSALESKKYAAHDRFHGPYGKIPTKKGPIRTLGFALHIININIEWYNWAAFQRELLKVKSAACPMLSSIGEPSRLKTD